MDLDLALQQDLFEPVKIPYVASTMAIENYTTPTGKRWAFCLGQGLSRSQAHYMSNYLVQVDITRRSYDYGGSPTFVFWLRRYRRQVNQARISPRKVLSMRRIWCGADLPVPPPPF